MDAGQAGDVAGLLEFASTIDRCRLRIFNLSIPAVILAGGGAVSLTATSGFSVDPVGVVRRQGGPGLAAVEGAADVQVVGLVADRVGVPVGGGGVHHHDEVAVDEAAVALGDIVGVGPGWSRCKVDPHQVWRLHCATRPWVV